MKDRERRKKKMYLSLPKKMVLQISQIEDKKILSVLLDTRSAGYRPFITRELIDLI
jgi:hypothetical protein